MRQGRIDIVCQYNEKIFTKGLYFNPKNINNPKFIKQWWDITFKAMIKRMKEDMLGKI